MGWKRDCQSCGGPRLRPVGPHADFVGLRVLRCRDCGLATTYPPPDAETLADFYRGAYSDRRASTPVDLTGFDNRATAQSEFILRSWPGSGDLSDLEVLDIGCGCGSLLLELEKRGARARGYEPDPRFAEIASERLSATAEVQNRMFDPSEKEPDSLDLVTMSHVLEHVPDPRGMIERLLRLLRPDGALFIEVPNNSPRRARTLLRRQKQGTGHLSFFHDGSLSRLAEAAGGRIIAVETAGPRQDDTLFLIPFGRPATPARRLRVRIAKLAHPVRRKLGRVFRGPPPPLPAKSDWVASKGPDDLSGLHLRMLLGRR